jgi:hypothetical protein
MRRVLNGSLMPFQEGGSRSSLTSVPGKRRFRFKRQGYAARNKRERTARYRSVNDERRHGEDGFPARAAPKSGENERMVDYLDLMKPG